jgi:hypothetical protein
VSALLFDALRALGPPATRREIATLAEALRKTGDEEVQALLGAWPGRESWDWLVAIAAEAGALPQSSGATAQ